MDNQRTLELALALDISQTLSTIATALKILACSSCGLRAQCREDENFEACRRVEKGIKEVPNV